MLKSVTYRAPKVQKISYSLSPFGIAQASYLSSARGDSVRLTSGIADDGYEPDIIYITSLFTYVWEPFHEVIRFYSNRYRKARIVVGGVYASLCPDRLKGSFGD